MKLVRTVLVFDQGQVSHTRGWQMAYRGFASAIKQMVNPVDSIDFAIRPKAMNGPQWLRNGVAPIKAQFITRMLTQGWKTEEALSLDAHISQTSASKPWLTYPNYEPLADPLHSAVGELDFLIRAGRQRVAIEWETGNVSSSHRSLNKLTLALLAGLLDACVLIVPSRELYTHLTDRIGNWKEVSPYLSFWRQIGELGVVRGLLAIVVVEHDRVDAGIPYLKMGTDGRSAEGKLRLGEKR